MSSRAKWSKIEAESGVLPRALIASEDHDLAVFISRSLEGDLRKAEALCLSHPTEALEVLRTLSARGRSIDALAMLRAAFAANPALDRDPEWTLEEGRLHVVFEAWEEAVSAHTRALSLNPSPSTRMTALQSRSIALYESNRFTSALADIAEIRSLGRLFPRARVLFYAEILALKIAALERDVSVALADFWRTSLAEPSLDLLLTLLRLEAHALRCAGRDPTRAILACEILAERMGDDLYAALARLELWSCGARDASSLNSDRIAHPKVARLVEEISSGVSRSTTSRLLARSRASARAPFDLSQGSRSTHTPFAPHSPDVDAFIIPQRSLVVLLDPLRVMAPRAWTRPMQALTCIARAGAIPKAELFAAMFGSQKYVEALHGATVHQLLSRARRATGLSLSLQDSIASLERVLLVETT